MELIDGKKTAELIRDEIAAEVRIMLEKGLDPPHLAAILVGDDPASLTYVRNKEKACAEAGFTSSVYRLPGNISEAALLETIDFLNKDPEISGFIVQLPLPSHIDENKVVGHIDYRKDVDGFHPLNTGRMVKGLPCLLPATPYGIIELLRRNNIETEGRHCVILGRSQIVGTPLSIMLSRKSNPGNASVTLCHSKSTGLREICLSADILICAIGSPAFLKADMVKEGAIVIDVGIHRVSAPERPSGYRIIGDVDFDEVSKKCSRITPVPGGVGPMTIAGLLLNTLKAASGI